MIHFKIFKGEHAILRMGMFLKGHEIEKYQIETMKDGQIKLWFDSPSWMYAEKFLPPRNVHKLKKHNINVCFQYTMNGETRTANGYYDYETNTWYEVSHDGLGLTLMKPLDKEADVIKWGA